MNFKIVLQLSILALLTTGCVHTTVKVVDEQGKPVEGALVITEQPKYIMQSWKLYAYFTDKNGKAKITTDSGQVFSKTYHPLINKHLPETVNLYSVKRNKTENIKKESTLIEYDPKGEKKAYAIPLNSCKDVQLTFYPQRSEFIVKSKQKSLIESKSFYFATGDIGQRHSMLKSKYSRLDFYCKNGNSFNKNSIALKAIQLFPIGKFKVIKTHVDNISLDTPLEPQKIELANKNSFYIRELTPSHKPEVSTSKNFKEKLKGFNEQMVGGNQYTQELFDYLLRAVELSE